MLCHPGNWVIRSNTKPHTGGAWSSSARAARCLVKSSNERNPRPVL